MVLIQYVMDGSTMTANVAANRPAFSQSALHSLAGRECAITILNVALITNNVANPRLARLDFVGIQPTGRAQLISSGAAAFDESSLSYGVVFVTQNNYNATSTGSTQSAITVPYTFTAVMTHGNILGIVLLPYNIQPGLTPLVAWHTYITHAVITIDVSPID